MRRAALAVGLTVLAGCGVSVLEQRTVDANAGRLAWSARLTDYDGRDEIAWDNSGTQAVVDWSGTGLSAGSVTLQLFDLDGSLMYEGVATAAGAPARRSTDGRGRATGWSALLVFRGATGSVAIDVQGAP